MRRLLAWLLGLAFALFVVGVSVLALTTPSFTRIVAEKTSLASEAGLPLPRMLQIAEQVRLFVVDSDAEPLPATVDGRPGFDAQAVSHLIDVRKVFLGTRGLTGVLALVLALAIGLEIARKETRLLSDALLVGAAVGMALVVLGVLAATVNFDAFFSAFHGLFFKAGTWEFPADSLLIQTFPEPFWMTAGAAWGALVALGASAMIAVGSVLRKHVTTPAR